MHPDRTPHRLRRARRFAALIMLVFAALVAAVPGAALASGPASAGSSSALRPEGDDAGGDGKGGDGGDGGDGKAGGKSGGTDDDPDDAGDGKGGKGGKGGSDDDDDEDELTDLERARRAAARYKREAKDLKDGQAAAERKAREEAGKFEELYTETKRELDELKAKVAEDGKKSLGAEALRRLGSTNPSRHVRLMDLDDVDDEASAERAAKRLKREDPALFDDKPTRQVRSGGRSNDDDDDGNDDAGKGGSGNGSSGKSGDKRVIGVERLRRGYASSGKK
jgi:hypothetical protein